MYKCYIVKDMLCPSGQKSNIHSGVGAGRVPETAGKVSEAFGILYKPQCYKFYTKLYHDRERCTKQVI